jgi:hypothetical protein
MNKMGILSFFTGWVGLSQKTYYANVPLISFCIQEYLFYKLNVKDDACMVYKVSVLNWLCVSFCLFKSFSRQVFERKMNISLFHKILSAINFFPFNMHSLSQDSIASEILNIG